MNTLLITILTLAGFAFGQQQAPVGDEWQNPEKLGLNKLAPHAWFFSFEDIESARGVLPEKSTLWMSLDGTWKFNWVANPEGRPVDFYKPDYDVSGWDDITVPSNWNIAGLQEDGSQKYGTPIYVNVNVPFWHEVKMDDWREGVMRTPPTDWTMYAARNEVGSYRRTFTVPAGWAGKDVFINFDGVDSFFYLWINGKYVGFSKNSRNTASFNITDFLQPGENIVAAEVYRNSDGSQMEAQDMFRLPGIFRTIALEAKPKICVKDIKVTPSFADSERHVGRLHLEAEIFNPDPKRNSGYTITYSLYECELYSDENTKIGSYLDRGPNATIQVSGVKPWSAEAPHRYVLVGELKDRRDQVLDVFSTYVGFRDIAIADWTAKQDEEFGIPGRYFLMNGQPVKLRGVNRHETEPSMGHAITREVMLNDVMMMKRANINHVRDSHYPDAQYWYYLCSKYGIYLMDEANNESHHYHYGPESLSHAPEWEACHVARMMEMVHQNYNHPCILIWSMGNEAGPGQNFKAAYDAAKAFDPQRPVQYERNNDYSDIGCRQYPTVEWVENVATGKADVKCPYHINEFAHSMGNALGDFADYWRAMDSNNHFIGGCVWDWVDQSLYNWLPDGRKYLAYGGDFGDIPNDGQFVMNGLISGDREPKPQYYEVQKVYQPLYTRLEGDGLYIQNRNYFEYDNSLGKLEFMVDGRKAAEMPIFTCGIAPRWHSTIYFQNVPDIKGECYLNVTFRSVKDLPWAPKGSVVSVDQIPFRASAPDPDPEDSGKRLKLSNSKKTNTVTIEGEGFSMVFNSATGTVESLNYGGREVLVPGFGPQLNAHRAFVNNDAWHFRNWYAEGLHNLQHSVVDFAAKKQKDGSVLLTFTVESKAPCGARIDGGYEAAYHTVTDDPAMTDVIVFCANHTWVVRKDGQIDIDLDIVSTKPAAVLPRLGLQFKVPAEFGNLEYYGRGPGDNYSDRCTASFIGRYSSTVAEQYVNHTFPQECGNHEQCRWLRVTAEDGAGFEIVAKKNNLRKSDFGGPVFSFQALPYAAEDIMHAGHFYQLPEPGDTYLNIDAAVLGLGGGSCGPAQRAEHQVHSEAEFSFSIKPIGLALPFCTT